MDTKPTRFNLLYLKERKKIYFELLSILKARRLALIKVLLSHLEPFLKTHKDIKITIREAVLKFKLSTAIDGNFYLKSLTDLNKREFPINVINQNVYGIKYKQIIFYENVLQKYDERKYDPSYNSPYLEMFERKIEETIEQCINLSNYEKKIRVIAEEILKLNKKIRVLEERLIPDTTEKIKKIKIYLAEKERENFYKLKLFKNKKTLPFCGRV